MLMSATVVPWYLIATTRSGKTSAKGRSISGLPSQSAEATQGVESFGGWIIMTGGLTSAFKTLLLLVKTSFIIAGRKVSRRYLSSKPTIPRVTRSLGTSGGMKYAKVQYLGCFSGEVHHPSNATGISSLCSAVRTFAAMPDASNGSQLDRVLMASRVSLQKPSSLSWPG